MKTYNINGGGRLLRNEDVNKFLPKEILVGRPEEVFCGNEKYVNGILNQLSALYPEREFCAEEQIYFATVERKSVFRGF